MCHLYAEQISWLHKYKEFSNFSLVKNTTGQETVSLMTETNEAKASSMIAITGFIFIIHTFCPAFCLLRFNAHSRRFSQTRLNFFPVTDLTRQLAES